MSNDESGNGPEQQPSAEEEEMRRAIEEQMRNARVEDLIAQSTVGIVNLTARRIAVEEERDLDQARAGIDFARAVVDQLPEELAVQVREALSQLQLQFATVRDTAEAGHPGPEAGSEAGPSSGDSGSAGAVSEQGNEGRKSGDSGLWTPPGSV